MAANCKVLSLHARELFTPEVAIMERAAYKYKIQSLVCYCTIRRLVYATLTSWPCHHPNIGFMRSRRLLFLLSVVISLRKRRYFTLWRKNLLLPSVFKLVFYRYPCFAYKLTLFPVDFYCHQIKLIVHVFLTNLANLIQVLNIKKAKLPFKKPDDYVAKYISTLNDKSPKLLIEHAIIQHWLRCQDRPRPFGAACIGRLSI